MLAKQLRQAQDKERQKLRTFLRYLLNPAPSLDMEDMISVTPQALHSDFPKVERLRFDRRDVENEERYLPAALLELFKPTYWCEDLRHHPGARFAVSKSVYFTDNLLPSVYIFHARHRCPASLLWGTNNIVYGSKHVPLEGRRGWNTTSYTNICVSGLALISLRHATSRNDTGKNIPEMPVRILRSHSTD